MDNQTFIVQTKDGPREFDLENYMILLRGGQGFPVDSKDDTDWKRFSPKDGQTSRQRVIGRTTINGEQATDDQVTGIIKNALIKPEERKSDGHIIPTLTDMGHSIAEYFSAENPFVSQLESIDKQSAETRDPEKLKELMRKKVQTERWRDDWERNLRSTTKDNGFFWQKPIEAAGDFLDAFDLATLPIPGGTLAKKVPNVLPKIGGKAAGLLKKVPVEKIPTKVGEYAGKVKGKITDLLSKTPNTLQADILQETGLEGVHGALQGQEGERGKRALEQGALAGLLTAGTHGLGGYWLRRGEEMNLPIKRELDLLRKQGVDVPDFDPFKNKGEAVLTPEQLERRRRSVIGSMNSHPAMNQTISAEELNKMIKDINAKMQRWNEASAPWEATRQFEEGLNSTLPISDWEKSVRDRLPAPNENGNFYLNDILPVLLEKGRTTRRSLIGAPGTWDLGTDADWALATKISFEKGVTKPRNRPIKLRGQVYYPKEPTWEGGLKTLQTLDRLGQMKYDPNPLGVRSGKEGMIHSLLSPVITMTESRNLPVESWNDLVKRITSNAAMDVGRNAVVGPYSEGTWSWPAYQEEVKSNVEETKKKAKAGIKDLTGKARKEAVEIATEAAQNTLKGKRGE